VMRNLGTHNALRRSGALEKRSLKIRAFCAFIARNQRQNALPSYILLLSFGKFLI
jgi:hypothetical protein